MPTPKARALTDEEIRIATRLRHEGVTDPRAKGVRDWRKVAKMMGVSECSIIKHFDPAAYARRHGKKLDGRDVERVVRKLGCGVKFDGSVYVPPHILEERERALSIAPSITAAIFGDPLPGRSALDRKRMEAM